MKPDQDGEPCPPVFSAFISYSHADAAKVRKLHSQIEAYRLPAGIGAIDALNRQHKKLGKIFRDREDLSAAHDLSVAVTDALDRSAVLVVACSPEAKASRWVNREIDYFRRHQPDRPVLAAILAGEPEEAFPEALRAGGVEPLAADLRKQGDGWRLGFLKVIAGIARVPLDTLVQRDGQRQMRRVMAVTGMVTLIAIAMGVMTTIAIQARNEAQFQRNEADGLVAYMMGELRTQLRGVGRIEVMQGVNEKALQYYTNQGDLAALRPDSLGQRSIVLHAIGEDAEKSGDPERAFLSFEEAHRSTAELLKREPDNADRIFAHAQSEYWVGFAAWQTDAGAAQGPWSRYLELARRLQEIEPDATRSLMELGYANGNLCELSVRQGQIDRAVQYCESSIEFISKAAQKSPQDSNHQISLANRHGWMADTLMLSQRHDDAFAQREKEHRILKRLIARDPDNFRFQLRATWPIIGMAEVALDQQQGARAANLIGPVVDTLERLGAGDPSNGEVATVQMRALLLRARGLHQAGASQGMDYRPAEALAAKYAGHEVEARLNQMIDGFKKEQM